MSQTYCNRATSPIGTLQSEAHGSSSNSRTTTSQQKNLDALSAEQAELMEARERLLVDREEVLTQRKELRKRRVRTGDAEVELMSAFRQVFVQIALPVPSSLLSAYETVENEHQSLRELEEEYLEAEEDLGASEWDFMDLENDFYQHRVPGLLSSIHQGSNAKHSENEEAITPVKGQSILPTPYAEYHSLIGRHNRLTTQFEALRGRQRAHLDLDTVGQVSLEDASGLFEDTNVDREVAGLASDLLDMIVACETRMQQLEPDLDLREQTVQHMSRRLSQPNMEHDLIFSHVRTASRACSEGAAPSMDGQLSLEELIGGWSLRSLKSSAMEKVLYLNIMRDELNMREAEDVKFGEWNDEITRVWNSDHRHSRPRLLELDGSIDVDLSNQWTRPNEPHPQLYRENSSAYNTQHAPVTTNARCANTSIAAVSQDLEIPTIRLDPAPVEDSSPSSSTTYWPVSDVVDHPPRTIGNARESEAIISYQGIQHAMPESTSLVVNSSGTGGHLMTRCDSAQDSELNPSMEPQKNDYPAEVDTHVSIQSPKIEPVISNSVLNVQEGCEPSWNPNQDRRRRATFASKASISGAEQPKRCVSF